MDALACFLDSKMATARPHRDAVAWVRGGKYWASKTTLYRDGVPVPCSGNPVMVVANMAVLRARKA